MKSRMIALTLWSAVLAVLCLSLLVASTAATANQVDGATVAHGPWKLTIQSRVYDFLVFSDTPPPEGKAQARIIAKGTQARTRAFGRSRQEAQGMFIEIQLQFVNTSGDEHDLTINSLSDFSLSDQGKVVEPFGIRTLGIERFETAFGVIDTLSGEVTIRVPPGEEDSKVVVLFDYPASSEKLAFRFKDFPSIPVRAAFADASQH